jgi:hypothetical protein
LDSAERHLKKYGMELENETGVLIGSQDEKDNRGSTHLIEAE